MSVQNLTGLNPRAPTSVFKNVLYGHAPLFSISSHPQRLEISLSMVFVSNHCYSLDGQHSISSKPLLPLVCYVFQDGPWRDTLVRFQYDPRKDPKARLYVQSSLRCQDLFSCQIATNDFTSVMPTTQYPDLPLWLAVKTDPLQVLKPATCRSMANKTSKEGALFSLLTLFLLSKSQEIPSL